MRRQAPKLRLAPIRSISFAIGCAMSLACGGVDDGSSEAVERFTQACVAATELEDPICRCVGGHAAEDLPDDSVDLLVAILSKDTAEAQRLRSQMPQSEWITASMYMARAPSRCTDELRAP